jgi:hypothetical protein
MKTMKIPSTKKTNLKQIPMTEMQNSKQAKWLSNNK